MKKISITSIATLSLFAGAAAAAPGDLLAELVPSTAATNDLFGNSISIDGDRVLVGSRGLNKAILFDITDPTAPSELRVYSSLSVYNVGFGASVALEGSNVVISQEGGIEAGVPLFGVSYFNSSSSSLVHQEIGDETRSLTAGSGVAISGTNVLVGESFGFALDRYGDSNSTGVAWFTNATNYAINIVDPLLAEISDSFGFSVDLTSSRAVVGAPNKYELGLLAGTVDVYSTAGVLQQSVIVTDPADRNFGDQFGFSVSIAESSNYLLVGAPGDDEEETNAGAAYLYDLNTNSMVYKFAASDAQSGDNFGYSVELTDQYAIVGAPKAAGPGSSDRGAVYIFDLTTGSEIVKIQPDNTTTSHFYQSFGSSIDSSGSIFVVGASDFFEDNGSAFVFSMMCNDADLAEPFGVLNNFDVSAFTSAWSNNEASADLNGDGIWNFFDLSVFMISYSAGCP
mgnify:CR=1 FL=1|tara:strand:- start:144 stop:1505 length:1362 start_codon:yes stop_codon:yes gene_type:complete